MTSNSDVRADPDPAPTGDAAGVNYLELTFALMGGALAWLLRLVVNSSLVEYSCQIEATWPLWLTTAAATLVGIASLLASRKYHRMTDDGTSRVGTARWLGLLAIMFNVTAIAGIVLETVPVEVLDVCRHVGPS